MERKTLITIQKICKVGKVLCMVNMIVCLVGATMALLALLGGAVGIEALKNFASVDMIGLGGAEIEMAMPIFYGSLACAFILCAGSAVLGYLGMAYFKKELEIGTPFDVGLSKDLKTLGICTIVIPTAAAIISAIVQGIFSYKGLGMLNIDIDNGESIVLGITIIIVSILCKYGAELRETGEKKAEE